jgi:hypothetical protein
MILRINTVNLKRRARIGNLECRKSSMTKLNKLRLPSANSKKSKDSTEEEQKTAQKKIATLEAKASEGLKTLEKMQKAYELSQADLLQLQKE